MNITPEKLHENPQLFIKIIEENNIKPKQLGITSNYICKIRKGERKPSIELCKKLLEIIEKSNAALPARRPCEAFRTSQYLTEIGQVWDRSPINVQYLSNTLTSQGLRSDLNITQNVRLLSEFKEYLLSRYTKIDAYQRFRHFVKYGSQVLKDPLTIRKLNPHAARKLLLSLAALRDFLKLYGEDLRIDLKELRKITPRTREKPNIIEYEYDEEVVSKALKELQKVKKTKKYYILSLVAFFTGLRSTEIVYMLNNWNRLNKLTVGNVTIVEINYIRKSKKSYITMLPSALAFKIPEIGSVGERAFDTMRNEYGVRVSVFRKAHLAILSRTMQVHEIDLLQGRLTHKIVAAFIQVDISIKTTIKHYVKHVTNIARKYWEAFKPYIISLLTIEGEKSTE